MRIPGKKRITTQTMYKCDNCNVEWWSNIQISYHECPICGWTDPPEDAHRIGEYLTEDELK